VFAGCTFQKADARKDKHYEELGLMQFDGEN
jgi:hypothetical protein